MTGYETIIVEPLVLYLSWQNNEICNIELNWSALAESIVAKNIESNVAFGASINTAFGEKIRQKLKAYLGGESVTWGDLPLAMHKQSAFTHSVLMQLAKIPHGQSLSYSQLADLVGSPRAARAVGSVMANNHWPLILPCHRVLRSDGKLGGFSGAGLPMKSWLLHLESTGKQGQLPF